MIGGRFNSLATVGNATSNHGQSRNNTGHGSAQKNVKRQETGEDCRKNIQRSKNRQSIVHNELDWTQISNRIYSYSLTLPQPNSDEKVLYLRQGYDFNYCEQFLESIYYGADFFHGLIIKNFCEFPENFFTDMFKHVAKTHYPQKMVPLLNFRLSHSFRWPRSNYLNELPKHLEPKLIKKSDLTQSKKWDQSAKGSLETEQSCLLTTSLLEQFQPNSSMNNAGRQRIEQPKDMTQRVMYSLRNGESDTQFYVKLWYDPVQSNRYESIIGLTLRRDRVNC